MDFVQFKQEGFNIQRFIKEFKPEQWKKIGSDEIKYPIIHKEGKFLFMICKEKVSGNFYLKCKGSLHGLYNFNTKNRYYNYDDFNINQLTEVLKMLETKYRINLSKTEVNILEFGFNIKPHKNPTLIIGENILLNLKKEKGPSTDTYYNGFGRGKYFELTKVLFKIYDKGRESKINQSLLRLELKYTSKRQLSKLGIGTINDLSKINVWENLINDFLNRFKQLLILDSINPPEHLSNKAKELYYRFTCPIKLRKQRAKHPSATIKKRRDKFFKLVEDNRLNQIQNNLKNLIKLKSYELLKVNENQKISANPRKARKVNENLTSYKGFLLTSSICIEKVCKSSKTKVLA